MRCFFKSYRFENPSAPLSCYPSTPAPSITLKVLWIELLKVKQLSLLLRFDEFDAKPENVLQHIAQFIHRCEETGLIEDFTFIEHENALPSTVDMSNPAEKAA
jgi:hypothetical protein